MLHGPIRRASCRNQDTEQQRNLMNSNSWTLALVSAGVVSCPAVACGEEKPNPVLTSLSSTTISGYVDTSAQWNAGTGDANTPPYAFGGPGKADGFNLNVVKLTVEKPIEHRSRRGALATRWTCCSARTPMPWRPSPPGTPADFGVKQAYVALHAPVGNGLDFQMGVWDTIIGYEVTDSINNPNFTRSYGYTIEPPTHTGIRATYQFSETLAGIVGRGRHFRPKDQPARVPAQGGVLQDLHGVAYVDGAEELGFLAGSTLSGCVINGFNSVANRRGGRPDQLVCGRHAQHAVERVESGRGLRLRRREQSAVERQQLRQCGGIICLVSGHRKTHPARGASMRPAIR